MKLPRTIRLDPSDTVVFARAAEPGEWAVAGTFLFADRDLGGLGRKERIAFRTGFLGVASFGFSTLVAVTETDAAAAEAQLAEALVRHLGAPDPATALPAAREEIAFAASLCAPHAVGTMIALHREAGAEGAIRERFRTLRPRADTSFAAPGLRGHARAFDLVETDAPEEAPVDLAGLLRGRR
jgi:phenylpyruvate tautomerase PptA (4-oxalocrotonate tautomerase family)